MASEPYYQDEYVTLYLGDNRERKEWLQADVLVTDPPYGIAWTRSGISRATRADKLAGRYTKDREKRTTFNDGGILNDDTTEARDWVLAEWGDRPAYVFGSLLMPPPSGTKQVAIYGKPKDSGNLTSVSGVRRNVEAIYLLGTHTLGGGGRSAIFQTGARTAGAAGGLAQRYGHPHAKPVDVLEELIQLAPPGVIADPFAGSGSTLVAARNLGRKAIGVELEERYAQAIVKRLAQGTFDFAALMAEDGDEA